MANLEYHHSIDASPKQFSLVLVMVCIYLFLCIERPWESISHFQNIQIERFYAIILITVAFLAGSFKVVKSPTNKWVYGLLGLHFILSPFAFNFDYAFDQGVQYFKMTVLYLLILAVAEDERSLKLLIKAFVFSMMFYIFHSLWEYHNGRHLYRMGISRMIGVDQTFNDPNSFGASVVLSVPFVYALWRCETQSSLRWMYLLYFVLAGICIILTGSRSAFVALIFLFLIWGLAQKGRNSVLILFLVIISVILIWISMPEDKQLRIRTLWDEDAGPKSAHQSAEGRLEGLKVSWKMFLREPLTGVGAGGQNFVGYRIAHNIDEDGHESATQAHVLYGEVLAEFGLLGVILFGGMILSILNCTIKTRLAMRKNDLKNDFLYLLSGAILASLFLLLLLGLGGHNFYRPLWLWLAAWSGSVSMLWMKNKNKDNDIITNNKFSLESNGMQIRKYNS